MSIESIDISNGLNRELNAPRVQQFNNSTNSGRPGINIQYNGPDKYYSVTVSSAGDITLKTGNTSGSLTATDACGLPTANGVFDVSDSLANTFAKVLNNINATQYFRAQAIGVGGDWISNNTLYDKSETQGVSGDAGINCDLDVSVALRSGEYILPYALNLGYKANETGGDMTTPDAFVSRPTNLQGIWRQSRFDYAIANVTVASPGTKHRIYEVAGPAGNATLLYERDAGATTVDDELDFSESPYYSKPGSHLIYALVCTAAAPSALSVSVRGRVIDVPAPQDQIQAYDPEGGIYSNSATATLPVGAG